MQIEVRTVDQTVLALIQQPSCYAALYISIDSASFIEVLADRLRIVSNRVCVVSAVAMHQ
jgi:hypothetical protein